MILKKQFLLNTLIVLFCTFTSAQVNTSTPNLSFENGNFTNWERYSTYFYHNPSTDTYHYSEWTKINTNSTRFSIGSNNNDPIVACNLKNSPLDKNAARIGEPLKREWSGGGTNLGAAAERLVYRFKVTTDATLLSYKLAAVLRTPADDNHGGEQQPVFMMDIKVKDASGNESYLTCSDYSTIADFANPKLLRNKTKVQCTSSIANTPEEYTYQPWYAGNLNLSGHIGDSVIITLINRDCLSSASGTIKGGSHESYGYFWAETRKLELTSFSCENDDATISAPGGFTLYEWSRSDNFPVTVQDPMNYPNIAFIDKSLNLKDVVYYCKMTDSNAGCGNTLTINTKINPVVINPGFTFSAIDAGKIQFTDTSSVTNDTIANYFWEFGDGDTDNQKNPVHTYNEFKQFTVKLTVTTSKGCSKTVSRNVLPTKELIADIFPPANLQYNGQTKDFTAVTNISGLQMNIDYFIRYTNLPGTSYYNSYTAPSNAGSYNATFELSYQSLLKYFIITIPSKNFVITKAPLTLTLNDVSKTYGEKINLQRDAFTQSMKPLYAGDKIYEVNANSVGITDTASVAVYTIKADSAFGFGVDNYNITYMPGNLTVLKKSIIVKINSNSKVYGQIINPTGKEFTVSKSEFAGSDSINVITLNCAGFTQNANVGSYTIKAAAASGYRLSNYLISYTDGTLEVTKKSITITANNLSKTYGTTYLFSMNDIQPVSGLIAGDSISSVNMASTGAIFNAQVGEYPFSLSNVTGHGISNYELKLVNATLKVNPKPITITAKNYQKEYGDIYSFTGTEFSINTAMVAGDTILGVQLKSVGSIGSAPMGDYDIFASLAYGVGTLNYDFTYQPGTLSVVRKKITATLNPPSYLGYNAQSKEFTATLNVSGLIQNADYFIRYTNNTGTAPYNSTTAPSNAGSYTATFELSAVSLLKYSIDIIPSESFIITKAPLKITADNAVKTYGDKLNLLKDAFKTDMKPLYGSDKIYEVQFDCTALADTAQIGTYNILPKMAIGDGVDNYSIVYATGILTVNPKTITIKAINQSKTYGETINPTGKEFYINPSDLVASDSVSVVTFTSAGFPQNALTGTYPISITTINGFRLSNYSFTKTDGLLQVIKRKVNVQASVLSKTYGETYTFSGNEFYYDKTDFVGTDTIYSVTLSSQATTIKAPVDEYPIIISHLNGKGLTNYEIVSTEGSFKVLPRALTITANNASKQYGNLLIFNGNEFDTDKPMVPGDTILYVLLKSNGAAETAAVAEYPVTASQAYGIGTQNYDIHYITGKLSVVRRQLSASLLPPSYLVYNALQKNCTAQLSVNNLQQNIDYYIRYTNTSGTATYDSYVAPANAGQYTASFELNNMTALFYDISILPSISFEITRAPLTITANNATKVYGEKLNLRSDAFSADMKPLFGSDKIFGADFVCDGLADTAMVKTYKILPVSLNGNGLENYTLTYIAGDLTVTRKTITLKAYNLTKTYGDTLTVSGSSYYYDPSALVGNDKISGITISSDAVKKSATVGTYPLHISGAQGTRISNYQIVYTDGIVQIVKRQLTVTAKKISKEYGNNYIFQGNEFDVDKTELVGADYIHSVKLNSIASQKKASVGEYLLSITDVAGFNLENYSIKMQANLMEVTPKAIIVTPKDIQKEFGDVYSFAGNEFTIDKPMVNGDTISYVFLKSNGATYTSPIGEYVITATQAVGVGSLNYAITYSTAKMLVVRKSLLVTAGSFVKEYGEKDPELRFSVFDNKGQEYQPSLFSGNVTRLPGESPGTYTVTKGTLSISPSYGFSFTDGKLEIKKALPFIDPEFRNDNGEYIVADVVGTTNGDIPKGSYTVKCTENGFSNLATLSNGQGKTTLSGLPAHKTDLLLEYSGDNNYLPTSKTVSIFAINYYTNGGSITAPVLHFDGSQSVKLESATRDQNYHFEGWYEMPDFSTAELRRIPAGTYRDVDVYAKWSASYTDLYIVVLFNQILAVANPQNREFLHNATYKWFKDGVQLSGDKQYIGFDNYVPSGNYKVEIYHESNAMITLDLMHQANALNASAYPNPLNTNQSLQIVTDLAHAEETEVSVVNATGQKLKNVTATKAADKFILNGFNKPGIYFVNIYQHGEKKESYKVIVQD